MDVLYLIMGRFSFSDTYDEQVELMLAGDGAHGGKRPLTGRLGAYGILGNSQDIRNVYWDVQLMGHEEERRGGRWWAKHALINMHEGRNKMIYFTNLCTDY